MSNHIGWCDCTVNPIVGCTKCSPGCENCYAERFAAKLAKNPATAKKYTGVVDNNGQWTGKINFGVSKNDNDMPLDVPGKNKRVFVGSMSDIFHPNVRELTRDVIFASILCDHIRPKPKGHTFMILTKRAKEMCDYFSIGQNIVTRWWGGVEPEEDVTWPLPNLWLGVTVCNQKEADSKIPLLLATPAAKRFISVEPMLGPVNVERFLISCEGCGNKGSTALCLNRPGSGHDLCNAFDKPNPEGPHLDWVICGGESGLGARPMHSDWVRLLRASCLVAGVPFYFKGWGEWLPCSEVPDDMDVSRCPMGDIGDDGIFIPPPALEIPMRNGVCHEDTFRVGKKKSGHLLDGREWREFPAQEEV